MKLRVKIVGLEVGGKPIVILHKEDAEDLGIRSQGRIVVKASKELTAITNITTRLVSKGVIGVSEEVKDMLNLKENSEVEVEVAKFPNSLQFIKNKLQGRKLTGEEIFEIVRDVVKGNLSEGEVASFVTSLETNGIDLDEAAHLSMAMVETGQKLSLNKKIIVDKHSVGGVPGDKTTLILVPIIASLGLTIPKTSSRAITSAAGTADRAEVLFPVNLDIDWMERVVQETGGCIVWGGALNLAPADDIFIQIEYPLSIDPLLLPSIMSKKKAVGAKFLAVDIPTGRGTKIKTIGDATILAKDFIELGNKLNIKTQCLISYGEQPIGYSIGPALEAKEALEVLTGNKNVPDLIDKVTDIAATILEMTNQKNGKGIAAEVLKSGKAEKKMREIIAAQGGDPEIKPGDISIGDYGIDIKSENSGIVLWINNTSLVDIARAAGSPKDKGAGILLYKKLGDKVKKNEKIFTIFAEKQRKLERVQKLMEENNFIGVGSRREMTIQRVKEIPEHKKTFILER